jgi:hypothetical protein
METLRQYSHRLRKASRKREEAKSVWYTVPTKSTRDAENGR